LPNLVGFDVPDLESIDHVHVYTPDRVLGLTKVGEFEHWATKDGPLFLSNAAHSVSVSLFERSFQPTRSTIAFRVKGSRLHRWRKKTARDARKIDEVDHDTSWSLYFSDPDGNPF